MSKRIRFGLTLPFGPIETLLEQAKLVETAGFDTVWFPDHVVSPGNAPHMDAWCVLSAIAVSTKRIMLGPGVTDAVRRHPAFVAHCLLTLDQISRGRAILGLGAGEPMNTKPFGIEIKQPLQQLREAIHMIRELCTASISEPVTFQGHDYKLSRAFLGITPYKMSRPPIYLGALGPKTRRLAGELADGWFPYVQTMRNYPKFVEDIRLGAESAGRSLDDVDLGANIPIYLVKDGKVPSRTYRRLAIRLLIDGRTLRDYGWNSPTSMTVNEMVVDSGTSQQLERLADTVPREIIDELAVIGDPSEIVERLVQYTEVGTTHFLIRLLGDNAQRDANTFKEEVIPHFRDA